MTSCRNGGKEIFIDFEEIFQREVEDKDLCTFSLSKRRTYVNISSSINTTLNEIFTSCKDEIAIPYLSIKYKMLDSSIEFDEEDIINDIFTDLLNQTVLNEIDNYVETNYSVNLDGDSNRSKTVNEELQFTDEHAKIILKASRAMKLLIPVMSDFVDITGNSKSDNFFLDVFTRLFDLFIDREINITNKLYKLIDSRIVQTQYSDKVMWSYLKNMAIDTHILTRNFYKKVIVNILPKLEPDKSIVSYLHAVIKNFITYQFRVNYKLSFKPMNLNQTDSEGLTDFDKLEVNMIRIDEGKSIINKLSITTQIRNLIDVFEMELSQDEIDYYKEFVHINKVQTNLLFLFFARYMGSYNTIYGCSHDEYIVLLIMMRKWLIENNFPVLAEYLTAIPEKLNEKKSINKNKFLKRLMESKKYKYLYEGKYKFILSNLVDSGVIIKTISNLKSNKFHCLPTYEESIDMEVVELHEIEKKIEEISDEVLSLIELI